jgi:hypothetical protein
MKPVQEEASRATAGPFCSCGGAEAEGAGQTPVGCRRAQFHPKDPSIKGAERANSPAPLVLWCFG